MQNPNTIYQDAMIRALKRSGISCFPSQALSEISHVIGASGISPQQFFADAALAATLSQDLADRPGAFEYEINESLSDVERNFTQGQGEALLLDPNIVQAAAIQTNSALFAIHELTKAFETEIFEILGLRNLSSFVGETFKSQLQKLMSMQVRANPVQDGYPDLMALTADGRAYIDRASAEGRMSDKATWSPYPFGGIEIKATCGETPPARITAKPRVGESRIDLLKSFNWKAHHRATNNLLAVFWDFSLEVPVILAAYYRNDLTENDWGALVVPKDGSRATSVSIMTPAGVRRMTGRWVIRPSDTAMQRRLEEVVALKRSKSLRMIG